MTNSINFAHRLVSRADCTALLNGFAPDHPFHRAEEWEDPLPVERFEDHETLAHLMHRAGLFPSVGQARKNGWDRPIEPGFRLYVVGKRKLLVSVIRQIGL